MQLISTTCITSTTGPSSVWNQPHCTDLLHYPSNFISLLEHSLKVTKMWVRCRETRQCPEIQVTTGTAEGSLAVYAKTCPPPPATHTISLFIGLHTLANRLETYQKKPLTASSSLTFYPTLGTRHRWCLSLAAALGDRLCWRSSAFSPMEEHSFTNSRLSSISVLIRKVKTQIQPRSTKPRSAIRNCTTSHPKHCWHFFHV